MQEDMTTVTAYCNRVRKLLDILHTRYTLVKAQLEEAEKVVKLGGLKRNTRWAADKEFEGEWVVIPREDFINLRDAVAAYDKAKEEK